MDSESEEVAQVIVSTERHAPSRGAGDVDIELGKLAAVPRMDSASLLRLAPGVLLTNAGGLGHPYQIFLRGFDAREGQDIEFTVEGMPINEVGNPHGNGLADTHFIIPELVERPSLSGPKTPAMIDGYAPRSPAIRPRSSSLGGPVRNRSVSPRRR